MTALWHGRLPSEPVYDWGIPAGVAHERVEPGVPLCGGHLQRPSWYVAAGWGANTGRPCGRCVVAGKAARRRQATADAIEALQTGDTYRLRGRVHRWPDHAISDAARDTELIDRNPTGEDGRPLAVDCEVCDPRLRAARLKRQAADRRLAALRVNAGRRVAVRGLSAENCVVGDPVTIDRTNRIVRYVVGVRGDQVDVRDPVEGWTLPIAAAELAPHPTAEWSRKMAVEVLRRFTGYATVLRGLDLSDIRTRDDARRAWDQLAEIVDELGRRGGDKVHEVADG